MTVFSSCHFTTLATIKIEFGNANANNSLMTRKLFKKHLYSVRRDKKEEYRFVDS